METRLKELELLIMIYSRAQKEQLNLANLVNRESLILEELLMH